MAINSQEAANRLCERINGDLEDGGKNFDPRRWFAVSGAEMRFANYSQKWVRQKMKTLAPSMEGPYQSAIKEASQVLGSLDIREMRKGHIEDYINSLPETLAPKTIKNRLGVLHSMFMDARDREDITRIPPFPSIHVPEPETQWLEADEQEQVLANVPEYDYPIYKFMAYYGLRVSECIVLMWDCVLWQKRQIVIKRTLSGNIIREERKAGNILYLPLTHEIQALLRPIRGVAGLVFRNQWGRRYNRTYLLKHCKAACRAAGVPVVSLHELARHSKGGQLINRGATLEQIAALFGHANTQTTKRYAKLKTETLRELVE
jgi:integrase